MVWSEWAFRHGPTSTYDLPPSLLINTNLPEGPDGQPYVTPYPSINRCNYPPGASYLFWLQGALWRVCGQRIETHPVLDEVAEFAGVAPGELTSPVVNTVTTRAINALVPTIADAIMAWGVLLLVRHLNGRQRRGLELLAFALTWLGPPIILNSAFWTQVDSCVTFLMVWTVLSMMRQRFVFAGVLLGAALMTKAQAVLLLPAIAFALIGLVVQNGSAPQALASLGRFVIATAATVAIISGPFMLGDSSRSEHGAFRWMQRSYVIPIQQQFPVTTLKAFNVWWLDYLLHEQDPAALDPGTRVVAGLGKHQVGQVLLAGAILLAAGGCAWRWRTSPQGWLAFAAFAMLAAFVFPTRVHERYIYYCLPFWIALGVLYRRWMPATLVLLAVGAFEMTWYLWLSPQDAGPLAPTKSEGAALLSLVLASATIASFAYGLVALLLGPRRPEMAAETTADTAAAQRLVSR